MSTRPPLPPHARLPLLALLPLLGMALAGCPAEPDPAPPDAGRVLPDPCNTPEEALSLAECELTLGEAQLGYISTAGDVDWYRFRVPATVSMSSLINLAGGYSAPATPVSLTLQLFREDGSTRLAQGTDRPGAGAPRPVELILPFAEPGQTLLVRVSDENANPARPAFDVRSAYSLGAQVLENPDEHEPNDVLPTPVPLTGAPLQEGGISGYLATENDVDRFAFQVTGADRIAYVRVSAPAISPPPPFRLSYVLLDPSGTPISEAWVANEFLPVNLATARKVQEGTYTVVIAPYRRVGDTDPIPGDLRLNYTLTIRVFAEADGNEPNDTPATASSFSFSATGQTRSATGRLGVTGDRDFYAFDLPPSSAPARLHFTLVSSGTPGRFEPLPGPVDRQLRVVKLVTEGTTAEARRANCQSDAVICPKGYDPGDDLEQLVRDVCAASDPPQCLLASRDEATGFTTLRNFEGILPVFPSSVSQRVLVVVQDQGQNWADDVDYTLDVRYLADPDEAGAFSAGVERARPATLLSTATYPSPAGGTVLAGELSYGYGLLNRLTLSGGQSVRAPGDYDAVPTDVDSFQIALPPHLDPLTAPDKAWALEWSVEKRDGGTAPYDLALELTFCDGDRMDGGVCTQVTRASRGAPLTVAYFGGKVLPWYGPPVSEQQPAFTRTDSPTARTVAVDPSACFCFEPRFIRGGTMWIDVVGVDRTRYESTSYAVRMASAPYPQSFTAPDGGARSCPAPTPYDDAGFEPGCVFTRQP